MRYPSLIVLFTDFGVAGPYLGQVKVVLAQGLGQANIIELISDAPTHNPKASSYLLAALSTLLPKDVIVVAVVDPGVGSSLRDGVVVEADGRFFIGPGNGLFGVVCQQAQSVTISKINWRPAVTSVTFDGRDIFAPLAVKLVTNQLEPGDLLPLDEEMPILGPPDLAEIVYVDYFGNLVTGLRGHVIDEHARLILNNYELAHARTYSSVTKGQGFWYVNSSGLIEIAVNCGRACLDYEAVIGHAVRIVK